MRKHTLTPLTHRGKIATATTTLMVIYAIYTLVVDIGLLTSLLRKKRY